MKHIIVAMSGGVDSSVTAYLLKQQGYKVTGLFMSLGTCLEKSAPKRKACCSIFDARDARNVADKIGIDFSVLDFKPEFEKLIDYFCREYDRGRTPNPCIRCNQYLKFMRLWEYAEKLGADFIATGHYARIVTTHPVPSGHPSQEGIFKSHLKRGDLGVCDAPRYLLKKGIDPDKDQSYVLFPLTQEQLRRTILPLGNYTKSQVRKIAREINLSVQDKLESQEICFVPERSPQALSKFLKSRIPNRIKKGEVRDLSGKLVGTHPGYQLFTIGQRHGLRIALGKPTYVVKIIPETNTIIVGDKKDIFQKTLIADEVNWISIPSLKPGKTLEVEAKIRYRHKPTRSDLTALPNGDIQLTFREPQPSITPGQAVVFYQNDTVLGGGWIKESLS